MILTNRVTVNTLSQLTSRGLIIVLGLVTTSLLRRYFGQTVYGDFIFLLNLITMFVAFADLGTHLTAVRESAQLPCQKSNMLGHVVLLRGLLAIVAIICASIVFQFTAISGTIKDIWGIAILLILVIFIKETVTMVLHAQEKLYWTSLVQVMTTIITLVAVVGAIAANLQLGAVFTYMALGIGGLSLPLIAFFIFSGVVTFTLKPRRLYDLLKISTPIGCTLILFTVYSRFDTVLIHNFYGSAVVGAYGLAYKIYENLVLPAAFLLNALLPELSRATISGTQQLKILLSKSLLVLIGASSVIIVLTYIGAPIAMRLLTGEESQLETVLMRILVFSTLFAFANHLTGYTLIALKKQNLSLLIAGIALLFNVVANWVLLPVLGVTAAAVITIATEALVLLLSGAAVVLLIKKEAQ